MLERLVGKIPRLHSFSGCFFIVISFVANISAARGMVFSLGHFYSVFTYRHHSPLLGQKFVAHASNIIHHQPTRGWPWSRVCQSAGDVRQPSSVNMLLDTAFAFFMTIKKAF